VRGGSAPALLVRDYSYRIGTGPAFGDIVR
jgi:hypothetical protein